ncbi:MAG: WxL domain-containing protein [Lactobacillales bacterium]|jgi:hypothetical protein|nr:WxL domain-containing protein [Lactobacillales bacterium]
MNSKLINTILTSILVIVLLFPISLFSLNNAFDPTEALADSVTDSAVTEVQIEFLDSEDTGVVQPGTDVTMNIDSSGVQAMVGNSVYGYVKLLFAPNLHFGEVVANYADSASYDVYRIPGTIPNKAAPGWLNPFVQVADYSKGLSNWKLEVTLPEPFMSTSTHSLSGASLTFNGVTTSDVPNLSWNQSADPSESQLAANSTLEVGESLTIFSHDQAVTIPDQTRWSYVFGTLQAPDDNYDAQPLLPATNNVVDKIDSEMTRTSGVKLNVPRSAMPKVGEPYTTHLVWTISMTP